MALPNSKKKVLIVDDDASMLKLYVAFFSSKGYDVVAASGGQEALDVLQKQEIHLVILDLAMPGVSGEDVMRFMAKTPKLASIPIVIDTSVSPASGRKTKIENEFNSHLRFAFFHRPTDLDKISEAIESILAL